ncbi:glycosyltransferase family 2 protein [Sulfitobacter sabulilitoris]|uniref:Glycosyltransferase n=1 Tax=Sulfitobacter sabulilitoris TaxID=2562655 RepID=A0A5S3PFY4_9RHOB|nr:glycosyltransferase family 2 protein [Sulfitobacter sabulilitoris]TMM52957.1 glycosyltransferase [Sulfitobacter sabulilitoris]
MREWPTISVVIPNLNCAGFLERTIRSVLAQAYPKLDLIMVDGGSTDGSLEIIERHRASFSHVIWGPDTGQANAINKGFAKATGQILSWINSDDMLMPGGLSKVGRIFAQYGDIDWIVGNSTIIDETDKIRMSPAPRPHSARRFLAGDYQWVQQESCYWRRSLWDKAGGALNEDLRLAVDGDLWLRFFAHARLIPVKTRLGAFRIRTGQRSEDIEAYHAEMLAAIERHRPALIQGMSAPIDRFRDLPLLVRSREEAEAQFPGLDADDPALLRMSRVALDAVKLRLFGAGR